MPGKSGVERKYRVIAGNLREAIERGDYPPGSRLPGENDIMRQYEVARMTARQAIAQLVNEGIAVPRKGAGVYVREFRPVIREGIARLAQTWPSGRSIWSAESEGRDLQVDGIEVGQEDPPDHVRVWLDLPEEATVVVRRRRFVLDGKPVLVSVSYLPAEIAAGSAIEQEDPGPGGSYARLAELGYAPVRFREDLRSRMPAADEAERLSVPAGTPVVDIARIAYDDSGRAVEMNEMTADASAYVFRYDFSSMVTPLSSEPLKEVTDQGVDSGALPGGAGPRLAKDGWTGSRVITKTSGPVTTLGLRDH